MDRIGKKCVLYSRVSTEMQVDGFSLAGQKTCLTTFANREEMRIDGEYEDAGKSGKSIEGRPAFKRMLNDIKSGLKVDYVVVYKLSRFGRNAADVLNSLELIQDYGVNLICTDEGIDSSQASGRLLISVLSAVAQIERENILEQTMNGRREKARQGLWNGGQAPYGYKLVDGKLVINEEEAKIVRKIFETYVSSGISMRALSINLNQQGVYREERGNTLAGNFWAESAVRKMISNSVYVGMIEWGHRQNMKVKGSKEMKRVYVKDNIIVAKGAHEPIISQELWDKAQAKRNAIQIKIRSNHTKEVHIHPLSGILKCPVCGSPMTICANVSKFSDGTIKTRYCYRCSVAKNGYSRNTSCDYSVPYNAITIETLVLKAINGILANDHFIESLKKELSKGESDESLQHELENYKKKLKSLNINKSNLESKIDNMDYDEPNYERTLKNLNSRLDSIYENIYEVEDLIESVKTKIDAFNSELVSADTIIKILNNFSALYSCMTEAERKDMMKLLIKKIVPTKINSGDNYMQLDSIEFNFPVFKDANIVNKINFDESIKLTNELVVSTIDKTVSFGNNDNEISLEPELLPAKVIHIQRDSGDYFVGNKLLFEYIKEKYNMTLYNHHIREVKIELGIKRRMFKEDAISNRKYKIKPEMWDAIIDAMRHYNMITPEIESSLDEAKARVIARYEKRIKTKGSPLFVPKYVDVIKYLKEEYGLGVNSNSIKSVLNILGLRDSEGLVSHPKEERCRIIAAALIKFNKIEDRSYEKEISDFYKNRKKRIAN